MRAAHAHLWRSTMSNRIAAKLLAEFIGTFALIFIGAGAAAVVGGGAGLAGVAAIAFAHGLTVMAFAFAYGPVSGGHFNPSVTTAVLAAGAMRAGEAAGYIVSQLVGGLLGALLLGAVLGGAETGHFSDAWLYLTAPIVGAIVAAILHTGLARLAQERMATAGTSAAARTPAE